MKRPLTIRTPVRPDLENPITRVNPEDLRIIKDEPYGASWDADTTHGASRNALYDKIETLSAAAEDDALLWALVFG